MISSKAENILLQINSKTKLGDLRTIAKDIKIDHELAMELWSTEAFMPRLLAILTMDKKLLSEDVLNQLDKDMRIHAFDERNYLMDWLLANQLAKDKKNIALMKLWENSPSALQRRAFWVLNLARKQVSIKMRWYQRAVLPIICRSSLRLKVTNETIIVTAEKAGGCDGSRKKRS